MAKNNRRHAKRKKHLANAAKKQQRKQRRDGKTKPHGKTAIRRRKDEAVVFEGTGLRMEQHGRFLLAENRRTPEQHAAFLEQVRDWRKSVPDEIKSQSEEIERILLKYDPFDMLASLAYFELFKDPETYKEYAHPGMCGTVEYAALLYLKHPFPETTEFLIEGPDFHHVREGIKSLYVKASWYYGSEHAQKGSDVPDAMDELRLRMITDGLFVRGKAYPHHLKSLLLDLFAPFTDWLVQNVGFDVPDVFAIDDAVRALFNQRWEQRRKQAIDAEERILDGLKRRRNHEAVDDEIIDIVKELPQHSLKQARKELRFRSAMWLFMGLGLTFSFTPEDLEEATGIPGDRVRACLDFFTLPFGSIDRDDVHFPSPRHELMMHPGIRHDDRFIFPSPLLLMWAIQPRLEQVLNPGIPTDVTATNSLYQQYQDHRGNTLEIHTIEAMKQILPAAESHRNLSYKYQDEGTECDGELDGLAIADTSAFLVECKAGSMSESGRRGGPRRMERHLKDLVVSPHSQGLRAEDYIRQCDVPVFQTKSGDRIELDKTTIRQVFLVNVTLDALDVFTTMLYLTAELGIFEDGRLPWSVSIFDLKVISEMTEFSSQFIHFLERRIRLNEIARARAHDELDWFGYYLVEGLYFEDLQDSELDALNLLSYTTAFDDYYFYMTAQRNTPAKKPTQTIPEKLREIIRDLEQDGSLGYTELACDLLDWDAEARKQFVDGFIEIWKRTGADRRGHDFSMHSDQARTGVTVFTATPDTAKQRLDGLGPFMCYKIDQCQAKSWVGILNVPSLPGNVHAWAHARRDGNGNIELIGTATPALIPLLESETT